MDFRNCGKPAQQQWARFGPWDGRFICVRHGVAFKAVCKRSRLCSTRPTDTIAHATRDIDKHIEDPRTVTLCSRVEPKSVESGVVATGDVYPKHFHFDVRMTLGVPSEHASGMVYDTPCVVPRAWTLPRELHMKQCRGDLVVYQISTSMIRAYGDWSPHRNNL